MPRRRQSSDLSRRRLLRLCGAGPLAASVASGLNAQATFSTEVHVVDVYATVRDRDGKLVTGLTRDDFELEDEGRTQEIRYFAARTDAPLTLGMVFDLSGSQRSVIGEQREAARTFLQEMSRSEVPPEGQAESHDPDQAFLLGFNRTVSSPVASGQESATFQPPIVAFDSDLLDDGLDRLAVPIDAGGGLAPAAEGTALLDAVYWASEILSRKSGRKVIAVISDGVDTASASTLDEAVEAAQRADAMIYPIRVFDQDVFRFNIPGRALDNLRRGERVLKALAEKTGGAVFDIAGDTSLEDGFRQLSEELRSQYSLGYAPPEGKPGYRKIRVKLPRGYRVQAREGYYAAE